MSHIHLEIMHNLYLSFLDGFLIEQQCVWEMEEFIMATNLNSPVTVLMELSESVSKEAPWGQTSDPSSVRPGATAMFVAVLALAA